MTMRKNGSLPHGVGAFGKRRAGLERSRNGKRGKKCCDTAMGTVRVFLRHFVEICMKHPPGIV